MLHGDPDLFSYPPPIRPGPLDENPLVSILIANYNYGQFVGRALESMLEQTYPFWEAIVCDDGSIDDSREVINRFRQVDRRIVLITQENGGMASAWNQGFTHARGNIIAFLDADDFFLPGKLLKVIEFFKSHADAGLVAHPLLMLRDGKTVGRIPLAQLPNGWLGPPAAESGGVVHNLPPTSGLAIRREVAEYLFPIPKEFKTNADGVIQRVCPLLTPVVAIAIPLGVYRIHERNITFRLSKDAGYLDTIDSTYEKLWHLQVTFLERFAPQLLPPLLRPYENSLLHKTTRLLIHRERLGFLRSLPVLYAVMKHPAFSTWPLSTRLRLVARFLLGRPPRT